MHFFWKPQIVLVELYNHYCPWHKNGEEVDYKIREKNRKTWNPPADKARKKAESVLEEVRTDQRIRCEGLERFASDPESVEKFRGYCRVDWDYYFL